MTDEPAQYYVLFVVTSYTSLDAVMADAPDLLSMHVARSRELHSRGEVLMAGAFLDRPEEPLSTMSVFTTREEAEAFAAGDPFIAQGKVQSWHIRTWANMFAGAI